MTSFLWRKFGDLVDGLDIVGDLPLAIGIEKHKVELEVQVKIPYDFPNEIVLKLIGSRTQTLEELTSFMGLEDSLVSRLVAEEMMEGNVAEASGLFSLTKKGEHQVENLMRQKIQHRKLSVGWDTLGGLPIELPEPELFLEDLQAQEPSLLTAPELLPTKRDQKTPRRKFDVYEMNDLLDSESLAVIKVSNQRFTGSKRYILGTLLVFSDAMRTQVEYRLILNGRESEKHRSVVNSPAFSEAVDIKVEPAESNLEIASLGIQDFKNRAPEEFNALQEAVLDLDYADDAEPDAELLRPEGEITGGVQELRQFTVVEHAPFLREALVSASRRLMIVSPWITRRVVDEEFIQRLKRLSESGVEIDIIYGIKDDDRTSKSAVGQLCKLSDEHQTFRFYRHDNNHSKILIVDDVVIATSFNWLSYRGDASLTFRREEGILVKGKTFAEPYYLGWQSRIQSECQPACNF